MDFDVIVPHSGMMITVASLSGLWRRSLLAFADGGRDETSAVFWLQAEPHFADLRQPAGAPDFSHMRGMDDLTADDCAWLAKQQGFAGVFRQCDDCFEWVRMIDYCPPGPFKDIGRLYWKGDVLVEEGRDVPYVEHWHRDAPAGGPVAALVLAAPANGAAGCLVRAGADFFYARGRAAPIAAGANLAALVAAAPLEAARRLLDCEISQGRIEGRTWRISRSTLPFRVGDALGPGRAGDLLTVGDRAPAGEGVRTAWRIVEARGDTSALFDVSA
jgi:hypothetical protein